MSVSGNNLRQRRQEQMRILKPAPSSKQRREKIREAQLTRLPEPDETIERARLALAEAIREGGGWRVAVWYASVPFRLATGVWRLVVVDALGGTWRLMAGVWRIVRGTHVD